MGGLVAGGGTCVHDTVVVCSGIEEQRGEARGLVLEHDFSGAIGGTFGHVRKSWHGDEVGDVVVGKVDGLAGLAGEDV